MERISIFIYFAIPLLFLVSIKLFFSLKMSIGDLFIIIFLLFFILILETYARLSYKHFLYEINQREVRIESGIIWKKSTTIPYERIQNVDIKRGVIARMFGFSSVEIETAGNSMKFKGWMNRRNKEYHSEGYIPAVSIEDAEKIQKFIMTKIKQTKGSGI